jgi:hemerythrin-like domain-containing protein
MSSTTSTRPVQVTLPGQSHTADGPHDLTGMFVMHHAFRRDLDRFRAAVVDTPVAERRTWSRLARRWDRFATVLHHHHTVEDDAIWPPLVAAAEAAGAADDLAVLEAMEAEHDQVDPALARCREAFAAMAEHPCDDHRNALDIRVTAVREALLFHLQHEECEALPLVQRTMTAQQWLDSEEAAAKGYPGRLVPFLLGWVAEDLPAPVMERITREAGPAYAVLLRLVRPWYVRSERRTFPHA